MLSGKVKDLESLQYPVIHSRKLDGVRCINIDGVATSRSLKPIPNKYVQHIFKQFGEEMNYLDGELIVGEMWDENCYRNTVSGVMSAEGEPDFVFAVFDIADPELSQVGFKQRYSHLLNLLTFEQRPMFLLPHELAFSSEELSEACLTYENEGYEGTMVRSPLGPYKMGRSTLKEGYLLKVKKFTDLEATIVDMEELMHNDNEAKTNELGLTERSTKKENKRPSGKMGKLVVSCPEFESQFKIGTGFTDDERHYLWEKKEEFIGKTLKFKYQECGTYKKPRSPVFLGFRDIIDL
jgi:DNA ligase-1